MGFTLSIQGGSPDDAQDKVEAAFADAVRAIREAGGEDITGRIEHYGSNGTVVTDAQNVGAAETPANPAPVEAPAPAAGGGETAAPQGSEANQALPAPAPAEAAPAAPAAPETTEPA